MTTEERRCDDLKSPREELAERIAEGDTGHNDRDRGSASERSAAST